MVSNRVAVPSGDSANYDGGLAVAVRSLLKRNGGIWFGWSGTVSVDEEVTIHTIRQSGLSYIVTDLAAADYQEYYNGFANRVLWPILHYRLDLAEFSRRDLSGYRRVNVHFANEIAHWLRSDDVIWVHPDGWLRDVRDFLMRSGPWKDHPIDSVETFMAVPAPGVSVENPLPAVIGIDEPIFTSLGFGMEGIKDGVVKYTRGICEVLDVDATCDSHICITHTTKPVQRRRPETWLIAHPI
jgi:trehalose 6-phosphate synthase